MRLRQAGQVAATIVFAASASLKLLDFSATADLFGALLHLSEPPARIALAAIIALEFSSAYLLLAHGNSAPAQSVVILVCVSFLVTSVAMWATGQANCGCFGSWLTITPEETVFKNVLLTAVVLASRNWITNPPSRQSTSAKELLRVRVDRDGTGTGNRE